MICRIALAVLVCIAFGPTATAQPGDRHLDMKARVLDILFPLDAAAKPYFLKMVLRFGDSDTQLVVTVYPDKEKCWVRRCEITSYGSAGMGEDQLSQLIYKMTTENPQVKEQEVAAKLKVDVSRVSVAPEALDRALDGLRAVRISPILADRIAVGAYSEYEYWYDNWQETVHYAITSPLGEDPQGQLGRWMIGFRENLPDLLKAPPARKP